MKELKMRLTGIIGKTGGKLDCEILLKAVSWLWLAAGFIIDIWYQLVPGEWIIDSDLAAEMILADKLGNEGTILSHDWFYSTELRVFNLQWFYRIGLRFFPNNWTYARTLAMGIFLTVVVLSWLFFMKACNAGGAYGVMAAAFAIMPFGFRYHFLSVYGGYYFVFNIFTLLIFGIILLLTDREYSRVKMLFLTLAGCILSFGSGLNGVRQMMVLFAPLCFAAVLLLYLDIKKETISQWIKLVLQKRKKINFLAYTLLFTFCNLVGYMINSHVLSSMYDFRTQNEVFWHVNTDTEIPDVFIDFIQLFGFRDGVKIFTLDGIASALGFAVGGFIVYSLVRLCRNYYKLSFTEQAVVAASICAIAVTGIVFCYMDYEYKTKYWLPIVPFGIMLIYLELKTDKFNLTGIKTTLIAAISAAVLICSLSTVKLAIEEPLYGKKGLYEVAEWLEENGYQRGIAEFWHSSCITEMTDGKIEMWSLNKEEDSKFYHWLQSKSHVKAPEGRVFMLLDGPCDETKENPNVVKGGGVLVYGDDLYSVYEFEDVSWMGE